MWLTHNINRIVVRYRPRSRQCDRCAQPSLSLTGSGRPVLSGLRPDRWLAENGGAPCSSGPRRLPGERIALHTSPWTRPKRTGDACKLLSYLTPRRTPSSKYDSIRSCVDGRCSPWPARLVPRPNCRAHPHLLLTSQTMLKTRLPPRYVKVLIPRALERCLSSGN
jgi:hypothetical protein